MTRGYLPSFSSWNNGSSLANIPSAEGNHLPLHSCNIVIRDRIQEGKIDQARDIFDRMPQRNVVSWNTMIMGYSGTSVEMRGRRRDCTHVALKLFIVMPVCLKDAFTWTTAASGLARTGRLSDTLGLLKQSQAPQPAAWAATISAAQHLGLPANALQIFRQMLSVGWITMPAPHSFTSAATAASDLSALSTGHQLLSHVLRRGLLSSNTLVGNSFVSMFSKLGSLDDALQLFRLMQCYDVASWNAVICGLSCHGRGDEAITLFQRMKTAGFQPDWITFVGLLQGCSYCGYVDEGWYFFKCMETEFGICRREEHYACMVDILVRAGLVQEAAALVTAMPTNLVSRNPSSFIAWRAFLHGCCQRSGLTREVLSELKNNGLGMERHRQSGRTVKDEVGCSWVQVREKVHMFTPRDESHRQSDDIYAILRLLTDDVIEQQSL